MKTDRLVIKEFATPGGSHFIVIPSDDDFTNEEYEQMGFSVVVLPVYKVDDYLRRSSEALMLQIELAVLVTHKGRRNGE